MLIIIDGYNLLKALYPHKTTLEAIRKKFVNDLSIYREKSGHEIVVVFDAGPLLHATREVNCGVVIIFSGQNSNADEWICEFVERNKGKEMLLVSRDRELKRRVAKFKVDALDVDAFNEILKNSLKEENVKKEGKGVVKYERDDAPENATLDELMIMSDVSGVNKDDEEIESRKSKGSVSAKRERRVEKKIKKL